MGKHNANFCWVAVTECMNSFVRVFVVNVERQYLICTNYEQTFKFRMIVDLLTFNYFKSFIVETKKN